MHIAIPQRLCHLPLVMDVLRRSKVLDIIDAAIPQHRLSEVSTGECVAVILCGVYVGAHSLWRIRERLAPYDMATVMQDPTFDLERFPEERLAKALDDLYAFGLDKLMSGLAIEVIRHYGLDTRFLHFDTTTLSFYGAYEREGLGSNHDGPPPPRLTFGHSKAKRPDLKQVVFGCLSSPDGGVPLLGKVLDGNCSDTLAAAEFFGRVRELVQDPRDVCLVADSKGWCDRTLTVVSEAGMRLLSRLPRSERLHRELMARTLAARSRHGARAAWEGGGALRDHGFRCQAGDHRRYRIEASRWEAHTGTTLHPGARHPRLLDGIAEDQDRNPGADPRARVQACAGSDPRLAGGRLCLCLGRAARR
jgi:hypothetical protein